MKLRKLLRKINDAVRPVHVEGMEGYERPIDNTTAMTTMTTMPADVGVPLPQSAPPNWVPSQQDEKPRH